MIDIIVKDKSVVITNSDTGESYERNVGALHYNVEKMPNGELGVEIFDWVGKSLTGGYLRPYTSFTNEDTPFDTLENMVDFMSDSFFEDASSGGGGGVPTLDPSNVIIGGESGNEYRTIQPKDLGWTTGNNVVFTTPSGTSISASIAYSADVEANTIVIRNNNSCVTTNTPTEDEEAVDYESFKGVANLTFGGDTTMANLNSAYPGAPIGFCVYNTQARLMWKKVPSGEWIKIQLLPMS